MEQTSSAVGLVVIVALYVTIGAMSAAGSIYIYIYRSQFLAQRQSRYFLDCFLSQSPVSIWLSQLILEAMMLGG
jgi:hypothetical protein